MPADAELLIGAGTNETVRNGKSSMPAAIEAKRSQEVRRSDRCGPHESLRGARGDLRAGGSGRRRQDHDHAAPHRVMAATSGTAAGPGRGRDARPRGDPAPHRPTSRRAASLYADLTVMENLRFYADLFGVPRAVRERKTAELLAFSRLESFTQRLVRNLSAGCDRSSPLRRSPPPTRGPLPGRADHRRRPGLAAGLLAPDLQLLQEGLTLMVSTPYLDEAERCHRVGLMDHGRLVACDNPTALRSLLPGTLLELRGPAPESAAASSHSLARGARDRDLQRHPPPHRRRRRGGPPRDSGGAGAWRICRRSTAADPPQPGGCLRHAAARPVAIATTT